MNFSTVVTNVSLPCQLIDQRGLKLVAPFAPLYHGSNEVGKPLMVFGRGATRGTTVYVTNGATSRVQGWRWGRYQLERSEQPAGLWQSRGNEITGTGGAVTLIEAKDVDAAACFYRIRVLVGTDCR